MKKFPCRCRKCGARKTFRKHPDDYVREHECSCGGTYRVDNYRRTREHLKTICRCNGVYYPHRKGSILGCFEYEYTDDDDPTV